MRKVIEIVQDEQEIEGLELSEKVPNISIADLLRLITLLELDEVLYKVDRRIIQATLEEEEINIPIPHVSDIFTNMNYLAG